MRWGAGGGSGNDGIGGELMRALLIGDMSRENEAGLLGCLFRALLLIVASEAMKKSITMPLFAPSVFWPLNLLSYFASARIFAVSDSPSPYL